MTYLLSIDPGKSTGIALGTYSATEPYRRIAFWQPRGGLAGFLDWHAEHYLGPTWGWNFDGLTVFPLEVVAEKFTPRDNSGFSHTLDSVEPLRIEGALVTLGLMPDYPAPGWQQPSEMYFAGGSTLKEKKKASQEWLKRYGMWMTGAPVGHVDGADVNSATLHAVTALRKSGHAPTLRAYFPPRAA